MSATITYQFSEGDAVKIPFESEVSLRFALQDLVKSLADKAYADGVAEIKLLKIERTGP